MAIPIAKINIVVPRYFPAASETEPILARFKRYSREQILLLREAGLVTCVNADRKLWTWTHRANVLTGDCKLVAGGKVSLAVERWVQDILESEMGEHAGT